MKGSPVRVRASALPSSSAVRSPRGWPEGRPVLFLGCFWEPGRLLTPLRVLASPRDELVGVDTPAAAELRDDDETRVSVDTGLRRARRSVYTREGPEQRTGASRSIAARDGRDRRQAALERR